MPELPEVEVLRLHLLPVLQGCVIRGVVTRKPRIVRPVSPNEFADGVRGATVLGIGRRGKYLLFDLERGGGRTLLLGHLGMTGRMFRQPAGQAWSKHAAVVFDLGGAFWVFEDARGFGRLTFDASVIEGFGPEPLDRDWTAESLRSALAGSRQPIKTRLLDQRVVAGVGNIYASEALFRARIAPSRPAGRLRDPEVEGLHLAIRGVLGEAIRLGGSMELDFGGVAGGGGDDLFYFGRSPGRSRDPDTPVERFQVYDRAGQPCLACGAEVRRIVQANRSTYFCPRCQR